MAQTVWQSVWYGLSQPCLRACTHASRLWTEPASKIGSPSLAPPSLKVARRSFTPSGVGAPPSINQSKSHFKALPLTLYRQSGRLPAGPPHQHAPHQQRLVKLGGIVKFFQSMVQGRCNKVFHILGCCLPEDVCKICFKTTRFKLHILTFTSKHWPKGASVGLLAISLMRSCCKSMPSFTNTLMQRRARSGGATAKKNHLFPGSCTGLQHR